MRADILVCFGCLRQWFVESRGRARTRCAHVLFLRYQQTGVTFARIQNRTLLGKFGLSRILERNFQLYLRGQVIGRSATRATAVAIR